MEITRTTLDALWEEHCHGTAEERGVGQVLDDAAQFTEDNGVEEGAQLLLEVATDLTVLAGAMCARERGETVPGSILPLHSTPDAVTNTFA